MTVVNSGGASPFTHETEMPPVRRWKVATEHADDAGVLAVVTEPTKCVSACGTNHVSSAVRLESSYRVRR